jgi:hypothetical protein
MTPNPRLPIETIRNNFLSEGSQPTPFLPLLRIVVIFKVLKFLDRDLIKKVESTLLNLEKKEPQKQEFFKVARVGSGMKEHGLGVQAPSENAGGVPLNPPSGSQNSDLFNEPSRGDPIKNLKKGLGLMGGGSSKKIKPINEEES